MTVVIIFINQIKVFIGLDCQKQFKSLQLVTFQNGRSSKSNLKAADNFHPKREPTEESALKIVN